VKEANALSPVIIGVGIPLPFQEKLLQGLKQ